MDAVPGPPPLTTERLRLRPLAPDDLALYGRALISSDDDELAAQLGHQVQRLAAEKGFAPSDALDEVAEATKGALRGGRVGFRRWGGLDPNRKVRVGRIDGRDIASRRGAAVVG